MNPSRTEPGPPLVKALAELMNRPAPIAPPLGVVSIVETQLEGSKHSHSNHLHMSALQITLEVVLLAILSDCVGVCARSTMVPSVMPIFAIHDVLFVLQTHGRGV